jgi:hypothetical protein
MRSEEPFEARIHVLLLMAVEERQPRLIRDKVNSHGLIALQYDHVFPDSTCGPMVSEAAVTDELGG